MSRAGSKYAVVENFHGDWCFSEPQCVTRLGEKFWDALERWDCGETIEASMAIRKILKQCPIHIDALHHLALIDEECGLEEEAYWLTRAAATIGLEALGPGWDFAQQKLLWGYLSNRPFLRAYQGYALSLMGRKRLKEAQFIFENILATNQNDNQGIRYILPELLFLGKEPARVLSLCKEYPDDIGPAIVYNKALSLVQMDQRSEAEQAMKVAIARGPLVAAELMKTRHVKPISSWPGGITVGTASFGTRPQSLWNCSKKRGNTRSATYRQSN